MLREFFEFIGGLVAVGGGLGFIVYQVFKQLAAKWLDARFDERLQALRHEQEKELEQLRFRISTLLDRATKLHQREFDVLPEAWSKLNDAFWAVRGFVAAFQQYPDIDRMTKQQQEEFIANCKLSEWEKNELLNEREKTKYYQEKIFWYRSGDSHEKARDAYTYILKNGIFVDDDIRAKFTVIHDLAWEALIQHDSNKQHDIRPPERNKINELNARGEDLMKELERVIHERLWPKDTVQQ